MLLNRNVYNTFLREARERPDAPAMVFPDLSFSYDKLNRLALAALLAASRLGASIVQDNEGLLVPPDLSVTHHFHTVEPERTPAAGSLLIDAEWSPSLNTQQTQAAEEHPEKPWLYV